MATTAPANSENVSSMDVDEGSPDAIRKYLSSIGKLEIKYLRC